MVEKEMQKSKQQQEANLKQNIKEGQELKFDKNKALFQKIKERKLQSDLSKKKPISIKNVFERNPQKRLKSV
jgi:hypothetical protein